MLTIANFVANYFVPKGLPDLTTLRARLDRLARQRLPAEIQGRLRLSAVDDNVVYRIRSLELDLWLDALGMDDGDIAPRWAALTLKAVTQALLYGSASEVVRYDDQAHFVAAFLGDLLAGFAWSRWMYEEFTPLHGLPVGQVAAHLLGARPALLAPVAQRLTRQQQLEPLIQQLQLADIRLIVREGLGFAAPPAVLPADEVLAQMLTVLRVGVALEPGAAVAQARNAFRLFLAIVMAYPGLANQPASIAVCHHLALLFSVWAARPLPALWQALARGEVASAVALTPLLASLAADLAPAGDWLRMVLDTPPGRTYLAHLIPVVIPEGKSEVAVMTRTAKDKPAVSPAVQRAVSSFAGLVLLLPGLRTFGLYEQIGNIGIYQLLLAMVGPTLRPLAWGDIGVAWLAGVAAAEMEQARRQPVAWPDLQAWDESGELRRDAEALQAQLGAGTMAAWALLVLRRFAQGLRGFAQSSPGYLAQQFLNVSGQLSCAEGVLDVFLNRAPLGIVLHMAGYDGDQGTIAWLGQQRLVIHLPEG